jgi:hypothetical protein
MLLNPKCGTPWGPTACLSAFALFSFFGVEAQCQTFQPAFNHGLTSNKVLVTIK